MLYLKLRTFGLFRMFAFFLLQLILGDRNTIYYDRNTRYDEFMIDLPLYDRITAL